MKLLLAVLLSALAIARPKEPDDPWVAFRERFELTLLPDARPASNDAIFGTWSHRGPENILGKGASEQIVLHAPEGPADRARIEITRTETPSVNDECAPIVRHTEIYRLGIVGPFLRIGDGVHAAALVGEDQLVLDAVVPMGGTWYSVQACGDDRLPQGASRVQEWAFDFEEDPLTSASGRVRVRHSTHVAWRGHEVDASQDVVLTFDIRAKFVARRDEPGPSDVAIEFDATVEGEVTYIVPRITIVAGGACMTLDRRLPSVIRFGAFTREAR